MHGGNTCRGENLESILQGSRRNDNGRGRGSCGSWPMTWPFGASDGAARIESSDPVISCELSAVAIGNPARSNGLTRFSCSESEATIGALYPITAAAKVAEASRPKRNHGTDRRTSEDCHRRCRNGVAQYAGLVASMTHRRWVAPKLPCSASCRTTERQTGTPRVGQHATRGTQAYRSRTKARAHRQGSPLTQSLPHHSPSRTSRSLEQWADEDRGTAVRARDHYEPCSEATSRRVVCRGAPLRRVGVRLGRRWGSLVTER